MVFPPWSAPARARHRRLARNRPPDEPKLRPPTCDGGNDDLPGTIEQIGEAAAVADFNAAHPDRPIGRVLGLHAFTPFDPPWADQIYIRHRLDHPHYPRLEGDLPEQSPPAATPSELHRIPLPRSTSG